MAKKAAPATLRTSHKKDLDVMSEAHRAKIERWEPMLSAIGAEHVWASSPRTSGRQPGPFYLAVKVAARNYAIVSFDTSKPTQKAKVLAGSITSPKTLLESFGEYRTMAKAERGGKTTAKATAPTRKTTTRKSTTKPKTIVRKTRKTA